MTINYFDIHSHLNFSQFDEDRDEVIEEMRKQGIATICVGTDKKTSEEAIELASAHPHIYATVGVHPTDVETGFEKTYLHDLAQNARVVAIGECGLDYYRIKSGDAEAKKMQKELFHKQIELARDLRLPLMIHGRPKGGSMDAYEEILEVLKEYEGISGNVHFFVGTTQIAKQFIELGFSLSFDGPVTFSRDYDEVITYIPSDLIMAETDAPFAAPVPHRGTRNSPLYVKHVVEALADIRGTDREEFREKTVENALRIFNISCFFQGKFSCKERDIQIE